MKTIPRMTRALAACAAFALASPALAQQPDFSGKTVTIVINFTTGSTTDLEVRAMAPYIAKNLPGNPTVIVASEPGGAGTLAGAVLAQRTRPDGLTLGALTGLFARWSVGQRLPFDLFSLTPVASLGPNQVLLTRVDTGLDNAQELASTRKPLFVGAVSPNTSTVMRLRLFLNALGQQYKFITGYKGQIGMLQAMMSSELNLSFLEWNVYLSRRDAMAKESVVKGLMQFGQLGDDGKVHGSDASDLETLDAAWRRLRPATLKSPEYRAFLALYNATSLTRFYALPPKTPPAIVAAWEKALKGAATDPAYLADLRKQGQEQPVLIGTKATRENIQEVVERFGDPAIKAVVGTLTKKR